MLKEYNGKNEYGYKEFIFHNNDITIYYAINDLSHGLYYNWCALNKRFWYKGYNIMEERNGHWTNNYVVFKYYL